MPWLHLPKGAWKRGTGRLIIQEKESYWEMRACVSFFNVSIQGQISFLWPKGSCFSCLLGNFRNFSLIVWPNIPIWVLQHSSFPVRIFVRKFQGSAWSVSCVCECHYHYAPIQCVASNIFLLLTVGWLNYSIFFSQDSFPTFIWFCFQNLHVFEIPRA